MSVIHVKDSKQYDELKKDGLVVVDFKTEWCGPCKKFAPVYEKIASEYPGVKFLVVDAEKINHKDCEDVTSVPTFKVFLDGNFKRGIQGVDEERLKRYIERYRVQIYVDDEVIREFTPELKLAIQAYIYKNRIKVMVNGEQKRKFDTKTADMVLNYLDLFD